MFVNNAAKKTLFILLATLNFGFCSIAKADNSILSKNDARQMFEITFGQWEANVKQISKLGLAQSEYASPLELSLIADVPMGRLITTPTYATKDGLPNKVTVTSVFTGNEGKAMANLTEEEMTSLISNVFEEMLPEFTVMTNIQVFKQEGVAAYTHQIFKVGEYPPLDKAANENKGCWQQCVAITP